MSPELTFSNDICSHLWHIHEALPKKRATIMYANDERIVVISVLLFGICVACNCRRYFIIHFASSGKYGTWFNR